MLKLTIQQLTYFYLMISNFCSCQLDRPGAGGTE